MAGAYLYGWDSAVPCWRKLLCNAEGKLIIDPSEIFEDPPTDGEAGKAATSNWSHDHADDVSAHHTKFTTTEHDVTARHPLSVLDPLVCSEAEADGKITTHKSDASAHHTKYTDAEARTAVGYNGTKYWSCPGNHFKPELPAVNNVELSGDGGILARDNDIQFYASVILPEGAVVTAVIVYGDAAAAARTWNFYRVPVSGLGRVEMATATINTADSTVAYPAIDNSMYCYYLLGRLLDIDETIYGARITYTI